MTSNLKQSDAPKSPKTINQKNSVYQSQPQPLSQLLQSWGKWRPATDGALTGSSDLKTLGEWLTDPRLEPWLNEQVVIVGPVLF